MDCGWTDSLGLALMGHGLPGRATEWARAAERSGVGSVWIMEDYFRPGAYAVAAAAAAVSVRGVIGLGVVNPYTRHPAVVAMETATLAAIAPGRVVLGLGSSNRHWIEHQMGIPFKTPLRGLRESVEIVRRLLNGERVTYAGELFAVNDVKLEAPPPSRVPIMLGVKGPRALALAAEIADGVHCSILASWPCPTTGPGPASGCDRSSRTTWGCSTASRSWKTQESRRPAHSRSARPSSRDAPPLPTW
ncbi:MAG: hypothetical protein DME08_08065 [Candidatus Rokuibacteriota bacterium]|nr:MAG: hypothetical protein DME08_08065 [Candidatus Rokubacteria bacterium]